MNYLLKLKCAAIVALSIFFSSYSIAQDTYVYALRTDGVDQLIAINLTSGQQTPIYTFPSSILLAYGTTAYDRNNKRYYVVGNAPNGNDYLYPPVIASVPQGHL